jgi:hypothetical protein
MGLGVSSVSGRKRVPSPPTRTTACNGNDSSRKDCGGQRRRPPGLLSYRVGQRSHYANRLALCYTNICSWKEKDMTGRPCSSSTISGTASSRVNVGMAFRTALGTRRSRGASYRSQQRLTATGAESSIGPRYSDSMMQDRPTESAPSISDFRRAHGRRPSSAENSAHEPAVARCAWFLPRGTVRP